MTTNKETHDKHLTTTGKSEIDTSRGEPTYEGRFFSFAADIGETEQTVTVVADLPGVSPETLDIDLRDDLLTIRGGVDDVPAEWNTLHQEYEIGGYLRQFSIGPAIDREGISASMCDGVLTLTLPKADHHRPRKIEVKTLR